MKVQMRDHTLQHRGTLPVTSGSAVIRNNDVSTWQIIVDGNNPRSDRFQPGWGIRVLDDWGNQLLSGPAIKIEVDVSADNKTRNLIISGLSDDVYLMDSLVIPNPPAGAEANADLWKASGPIETVMKKLVDEQIGPSAPDDYRIEHLIIAGDEKRGKSVSVSERFTNMLEVMQEQIGDMLFSITQEGKELVFRVQEARDYRRKIRLTRQNSAVGKYTTELSAPTATEVIVGGAGTGSSRKLWREPKGAPKPGEWGRRITTFLDRQSTSDSNELKQAAENELEEKGEKASVTFEANETKRLKYGRDFLVGDKITIDLDGSKIQDILQVVELTWDSAGRAAKMQVGPVADESKLNKATGPLLDLYRKVWSEVRRNQTR